MKMRSLAGREVSPLGLGCMGMSWLYTPSGRDDHASIEVINAAIDNGINLFDTADVYGPYINEELIGRAIVGRRDEVVISSKCGAVEIEPGKVVRNGTPEHVRKSCDDALSRLGLDVIDAYLLHRLDPDVPLLETWGAFAELQQAGKVRSIGLSEVSVEQLNECNAQHHVDVVQSELSLWTQDHLDTVVPWCETHDAVFMAYSPLGRGFLTGAYQNTTFEDGDFRSTNPRFTTQAAEQNQRIVDAVQDIAQRKGATAGQIALAWVLTTGPHVLAIPGTRRLSHLMENIGALNVALDATDLAELQALPAPVGERY